MNNKEIETFIELYETQCEIIDDNFEPFEFDESDYELLKSEEFGGIDYE